MFSSPKRILVEKPWHVQFVYYTLTGFYGDLVSIS